MVAAAVVALLVGTLYAQEESALRSVQAQFEREGRAPPTRDSQLFRAAHFLAAQAIHDGIAGAASTQAIASAISAAGGWDANPTVTIVRGRQVDFEKRLKSFAFAEKPATVVGIGISGSPEDASLAVILAQRRVVLSPFPRSIPKPSAEPQMLCGQLASGLRPERVYVTRPDGSVATLPLETLGRTSCAAVTLKTAGRHTVEIVASSPKGPLVASLFFVDVATDVGAENERESPDPETEEAMRREIHSRIDAQRKRAGTAPLSSDERLDYVAQVWAKQLADGNFLAHIGPDGSDLARRMTAGGYNYVKAGENLGLASGVVAAHFGIERSPAHRKTLLTPEYTSLGLGFAKRSDGLIVLVELFALPAALSERALREEIAKCFDALQRERTAKNLRLLQRDADLSALAQKFAQRAFDAQSPNPTLPGIKAPVAQIFEAMESATIASADLFVTGNPEAVADSDNLRSRGNQLVGIGIVQGDSQKYGKGRYWIAVFYAGDQDSPK